MVELIDRDINITLKRTWKNLGLWKRTMLFSSLIFGFDEDDEEAEPITEASVEGLKKLVPEKIAPFVVALASDAGAKVTGQIFGVRNNEIFLFSQPRPIRTAHTADGWTPESIADRVFDQFANDFYPLHRSADVFTWDPA